MRSSGGFRPGGEQLACEKQQRIEDDRHQDGDRAGDDDARLEGDVRPDHDFGSEPTTVGEDCEGGQRDRADRRDPQAGDDFRHRQRDLNLPEQLLFRETDPSGGFCHLTWHVSQAGRHVAKNDLQGEGRQGDYGCQGTAPGNRQEQEEERDRGDRVEHPGRSEERGGQPAVPMGQDGQRERDQESADHRADYEDHMLKGRVDVPVGIVDYPSRAKQLVLLDTAASGAVAEEVLGDLGQNRDARC